MLIGDVVLRAPMGQVDYLFNVTLPADNSRNIYGAPPDFVPVVLDRERDLTVSKDCFPRRGIFGGTNNVKKPFILHKQCVLRLSSQCLSLQCVETDVID